MTVYQQVRAAIDARPSFKGWFVEQGEGGIGVHIYPRDGSREIYTLQKLIKRGGGYSGKWVLYAKSRESHLATHKALSAILTLLLQQHGQRSSVDEAIASLLEDAEKNRQRTHPDWHSITDRTSFKDWGINSLGDPGADGTGLDLRPPEWPGVPLAYAIYPDEGGFRVHVKDWAVQPTSSPFPNIWLNIDGDQYVERFDDFEDVPVLLNISIAATAILRHYREGKENMGEAIDALLA